MSSGRRHLHLNVQATYPGHPAGWRTAEGRRQPGEDIAHFQAVSRAAEKALLDAVFQADSPSFTDTFDVPTRSPCFMPSRFSASAVLTAGLPSLPHC